jgi:glycolate oxidase
MHPIALFDKRNEDEVRRVEEAEKEIVSEALALGGTLSGEHGIGLTKKAYLPMEIGSAEMTIARGLKRVFDPSGILNPGKIFI